VGQKTGIEWCHHTFNPWWGCVEVSPGCDQCYAREWATRYGHLVWGKDALRRFFDDRHWGEPMRWDRKTREAGEHRRVFCASMADLFEERDDEIGRRLDRERDRLWAVIAATSSLDWMLLTKRPAGMRRLLPREIAALPNVWPGVTVESADYAWRVEELHRIECAGPRWASYEPALGPVDFTHWLQSGVLFWVVVGGESECAARPFDVAWARSTVGQWQAMRRAVFVKQLGRRPVLDGVPLKLRDRKGGDWTEWPEDLRVREFPTRPAGGRSISTSRGGHPRPSDRQSP
jgi:protein gp37